MYVCTYIRVLTYIRIHYRKNEYVANILTKKYELTMQCKMISMKQ